ncbi:glycoside hydrolase family 28 protein [Microbacterium sp. G2-8]|uniref:glycoside hydrolase family 28 protein n=1 Tax=Microbacterium sp. G2-8 TaxID=2842454 RepID=UPI0027E3B1BF|nr:glycoside hydrolase family 28 protein [Microbacterium sp. G2-8]
MQSATATSTPRDELETERIQTAIDRAADAGGGVVMIPPGVHRTGALRLRSRIELRIEQGATLQFVSDPSLYPPVEASWEGAPTTIHSPCLWAHGETDVSITGLGTIDGGGETWWRTFREDREALAFPRPTLVGLHESRRITLDGVTLRNSPSWTVHPLLCDDVRVSNVRIVNPPDSPNTDGIDPESSRNVRITGCHIDVGDDCIAIKAGTEAADGPGACENIVIANCTMLRGHGAVVIGSEMSGGVRGVVISSCIFEGTDRGIRVKTRRGRGGVVEDVQVANVIMRDVACPIVINPFYFCGPEGQLPRVSDRSALPVDGSTPMIRRIRLAQVSATDVSACAGFLSGLPEAPLEHVTLEDVSIVFADDPVPSVPAMAEGVPAMASEGFHVAFARDVRLTRVTVTGATTDPVVPGADAALRLDEVTSHDR